MNVNLIFLWSNISGYVVSTLDQLRKATDGVITVVHWDSSEATSHLYRVPAVEGVTFVPRSTIDNRAVGDLLRQAQPSIVVASGWMDSGYLQALRRHRKSDHACKVVAAIDDQWSGSIRQRLGQLYYAARLRSVFDYMWVAGQPQYAFAQRFGYSQQQIISNLLSADPGVFRPDRGLPPLKRFIYFGRFDAIKRLDLLVAAHRALPENIRADWPLVLVGDSAQMRLPEHLRDEYVFVLPYLQPHQLSQELRKGGVSCLVSDKDQWGVSIHEAGLMGMPQLTTNTCGAATEFVISNFNGIVCNARSAGDITESMYKFTRKSDEQLRVMGERSLVLASRITPQMAAASLLSVA